MGMNQLDATNFERYERIDGVVYDMSPSPTSAHQSIVMNILREISVYLKGKTCKVFPSPFDVYLNGDESGDYVIPDITVICDPGKVQQNGCVGVPDMVVEVLSPSTAKKDKSVKLRAYRSAGVRECWIVDPFNQTVEVYGVTDDRMFPTVYNKDDSVMVAIFDDLEINLQDIFDPIP